MQKFSYDQVTHLNKVVREKKLPFCLYYKDEKRVIIEKMEKDISIENKNTFKYVVIKFFKEKSIWIKFSINETELQLLKSVEVVAAAIIGNGINSRKVFAAQRGYGELKGGWEFPGGKIEYGETQQDALRREIREELGAQVIVEDIVGTVNYDYATFHLIMHVYWCKLIGEKLELLEHNSAKWLSKDELGSVNWLPADIEIVEKIKKIL